MHIENSFGNNMMSGSGSHASGYPLTRFIADQNTLNTLVGLTGGNLSTGGKSRFEGLVIPSGLVLTPENAKGMMGGAENKYKILKDIDIIEDGIFNELMSNITHKGTSKHSVKQHPKIPTKLTRGRK